MLTSHLGLRRAEDYRAHLDYHPRSIRCMRSLDGRLALVKMLTTIYTAIRIRTRFHSAKHLRNTLGWSWWSDNCVLCRCATVPLLQFVTREVATW